MLDFIMWKVVMACTAQPWPSMLHCLSVLEAIAFLQAPRASCHVKGYSGKYLILGFP